MIGVLSISATTLGEVVGLIAAGAIVVSGFIQITPIKINPWSWIARKIGEAINKEVIAKVDNIQAELSDVKKEVSQMQADNEERDAKASRTRILRFCDEILHGVRHSKDHFDEILLSGTEYDQYCKEHEEFKNHMTERAMGLITKTYDKCLEENTFL